MKRAASSPLDGLLAETQVDIVDSGDWYLVCAKSSWPAHVKMHYYYFFGGENWMIIVSVSGRNPL